MEAIASIENVADVLEAIRETHDAFSADQVWWRGQRQAWALVPGVYRPEDTGPEFESQTIQRFMRQAPTRYPDCPDPDEKARWLFLMQHYRLPTRLLDWTESPLAALYFALQEKDSSVDEEEDGVLWALDPLQLNDSSLREFEILHPQADGVNEIVRGAFPDEPPSMSDSVVALVTEEVDLRMLVQQSGFTVHGGKSPLEEREGAGDFLRKYTVSASSIGEIQEHLRQLGVRELTLFPDLDHLANDLAEDRY